MKVTIVNDTASPRLRELIAQATDRIGLNRSIGEEAAKDTRTYIKGIATSRHKTAERLGAKPTGDLARTAERVTSERTAEAAVVVVPRFIFRRAFESFWITPKNAQFLTIPASKISYGRRAYELRRAGWQLFQPIRKGTKAIANRTGWWRKYLPKGMRKLGSARRTALFSKSDRRPVLMGTRSDQTKPVLLYALRSTVFQKQDRTLLPSDRAFYEAAERGTILHLLTQ